MDIMGLDSPLRFFALVLVNLLMAIWKRNLNYQILQLLKSKYAGSKVKQFIEIARVLPHLLFPVTSQGCHGCSALKQQSLVGIFASRLGGGPEEEHV